MKEEEAKSKGIESDQEKVNEVLQNIFLENTLEEILGSESFDELEDWDSMSQMTLAYQLEKITHKKFSEEEIISLNSISNLNKILYYQT